MTTYLHKLQTITVAFSLLLLTMIASSTVYAASGELQTPSKFAPMQVAALAHPGAAVVHHRNAKERRQGAANQSAASTDNTETQSNNNTNAQPK